MYLYMSRDSILVDIHLHEPNADISVSWMERECGVFKVLFVSDSIAIRPDYICGQAGIDCSNIGMARNQLNTTSKWTWICGAVQGQRSLPICNSLMLRFLFEQRYHYYYNFLTSGRDVYIGWQTNRVSIKLLPYRLFLHPNVCQFQYE